MMQDERADALDEGARLPLPRNDRLDRELSKQVRNRIGTHLKMMYDSVVQQPIPDRFADLIARLDDAPGKPCEDDR